MFFRCFARIVNLICKAMLKEVAGNDSDLSPVKMLKSVIFNCYNYWTICTHARTFSLIGLGLLYRSLYLESCALVSYDSTGSL